jgi:PAS domain S-box-containing protein
MAESRDTDRSLGNESTERTDSAKLLSLQRDLAVALSSTSDLATALDRLLETCVCIEGIDCGGVYLVDVGRAMLYLAAHKGLSPEFVKHTSQYGINTERSRLVMAGEPLYRRFDEFDFHQDRVFQQEGLRVLAVIPVVWDGEVAAVLNLSSHTDDEIPATTRAALEAIAAQIGGVLARVEAETARRRSQDNLQGLFESLADFVFVVSPEKRILHVNPTVTRRLGYSLEEVVGKTVPEVHPADRRREAVAILADMLSGKVDVCRIPLLAKDGTLIPVETRVTQGKWDGQPALFGISRDVSDRVRVESLLNAENSFREALIRGAAEGLCVCHEIPEYPFVRFTVWSDRMAEITGYTMDQINRLGWYQTVYPDDQIRGLAVARMAEMRAGRDLRGEEWVITRADGEKRTLLISTSVIDQGEGGTHVLAMMQDITERKRMEDALRESEETYRALVEASPDAVTMTDLEGNITWASERTARLHGCDSAEDLLGKSAFDMVAPQDRGKLAENLRRILERGVSQPAEYSLLRTDGTHFVGDVSGTLIRDVRGEPKALIGVTRDITDRKNAEEQARRHLVELAHVSRLATMGEMASEMAHEINQPLAAIATYADTCRQALEDASSAGGEQLRQLVKNIEAQAVRAGEIVRRLRGFARKAGSPRATIDVNDAIAETVTLVETECRLNQIRVKLNLQNSLPPVLADKIQVQQLLLNLMRNALDAVLEGSAGRREIVVTTSASDRGFVEVAVRDSGTGIPAEDAERIFDAFFTTKPTGLGMGLAISRSIVDAHGGHLWVTPNADRGCTFRFTIPAAEDGKDEIVG